MRRDMELCRKILFACEEADEDFDLLNLEIPGYTMDQVAYHCKLLHDAGFIDEYNDGYADNKIEYFTAGMLTWEGHDFLDKVRENTVWNKTKSVITEKGLPMILDVVKEVSTAIITSMTEGAIKAILKQ